MVNKRSYNLGNIHNIYTKLKNFNKMNTRHHFWVHFVFFSRFLMNSCVLFKHSTCYVTLKTYSNLYLINNKF